MMTAKEAYELTNESIKITTEEHFKQMEKGIRERANKGEYEIILRVSDTISQSIRDYMVQQLTILGYEVSSWRENGHNYFATVQWVNVRDEGA